MKVKRGQAGETWVVRSHYLPSDSRENVYLILEELPHRWKRVLDLESGKVSNEPFYMFVEGVGRRIG